MDMKRKENFQMLPKELHQLKYEAISVSQRSIHLTKKTQERKSSTCYLLITKGRVPLRHGVTLHSHRAASLLVRLVEGEVRWEAPDHSQGVLPHNWGGKEPNHTMTCLVLKAKTNDRRKTSPLPSMNFVGLDLMLQSVTVDQVA
ncbi:hypothetical protein TNCV_3091801 [Trichonephila clavipes]|nr:hypothetical protein TNCV_3091801 [Trichonephila clavipes]